MDEDTTKTLDAATGLNPTCSQGGTAVMQPIAFHPTQDPISSTDGTTHCMGTGSSKGGATLAVAQQYIGGVDYENNAHTMDQPTGPLLKGSPTGGGRPLPAIATSMMVRRLTPVECERLQGFPDNYTNIPWSAAKEAARKGISYECILALRGMTLRGPNREDCPDGPRYKALGNSWAVPNVRWIGKRIQEQFNAA
jgi:DNA (cytosine-5)-methyltransferase 1